MLARDPDLNRLIDAAQMAGTVAMRHFAGSREATEKPGGLGPVTEADLEVDALLKQHLCAAQPDYGWLSEETPDTEARLSKDSVFILDPIDGTRSFIEGHTDWAHSIAIARQGEITDAVVFLPAREKLYAATKGGGATLNGAPIRLRDPARPPEALVSRPTLAAKHWPGGVPEVSRNFRSSLANRLALVAEGRFDTMFTFRATWDWDIAAGVLLVTEAGGQASDATGQALRFNRPMPQQDGIFAGPAPLHAELIARATGR